MNNDSLFRKIFEGEIRNINSGLVKTKMKLSHLLDMENHSLVTVSGEAHHISRALLLELDRILTEELKERLSLPLTFYYSIDVEDSYYLSDEAALEALQMLGELDCHYRFNKGKAWFSRPIGNDIAQRYRGLVQFMVIPGRPG